MIRLELLNEFQSKQLYTLSDELAKYSKNTEKDPQENKRSQVNIGLNKHNHFLFSLI